MQSLVLLDLGISEYFGESFGDKDLVGVCLGKSECIYKYIYILKDNNFGIVIQSY